MMPAKTMILAATAAAAVVIAVAFATAVVENCTCLGAFGCLNCTSPMQCCGGSTVTGNTCYNPLKEKCCIAPQGGSFSQATICSISQTCCLSGDQGIVRPYYICCDNEDSVCCSGPGTPQCCPKNGTCCPASNGQLNSACCSQNEICTATYPTYSTGCALTCGSVCTEFGCSAELCPYCLVNSTLTAAAGTEVKTCQQFCGMYCQPSQPTCEEACGVCDPKMNECRVGPGGACNLSMNRMCVTGYVCSSNTTAGTCVSA